MLKGLKTQEHTHTHTHTQKKKQDKTKNKSPHRINQQRVRLTPGSPP